MHQGLTEDTRIFESHFLIFDFKKTMIFSINQFIMVDVINIAFKCERIIMWNGEGRD